MRIFHFNRERISVAVGIAIGYGIWQYSTTLFGRREPWDGNVGLYALILLVAGLVLAIPNRTKFWLPYWSLYFGQVLFGFVSFVSPSQGASLFPIGAIVLLVYNLPASLGSYLGLLIARILPVFKK